MKRYETYEFLHMTARLLALAVVCAYLKIPGFSAVLPFAVLPATVCAGAAAHFHHKLPKRKKCSLFSKCHPAPSFIVLLLVNAMLFLAPFLKRR